MTHHHDDIAHLFVYGTLIPGQRNWPLIEELIAPDPIHGACARGWRMWHVGADYPTITPADPKHTVRGTLLRIAPDARHELLELCDDLEGHTPGSDDNYYERVAAPIEQAPGGPTHSAWLYHWTPARLQATKVRLTEVPGGDWVRWRTRGEVS